MTVLDYPALKQQVVVTLGASDRHGQVLNTLKEFYKDDIDSPRRFEKITRIGHLFNILEIRDILSQDNIAPLKETARRLHNNRQLLQKLDEYETARTRTEYINYYASEISQNSFNGQQVECSLNRHPLSNISARKMKRIIDTVVAEIGSQWRDLARNLEIREHKIDYIENNNNRLPTKAAKLMEEFMEIADPQRWFFVLCNALEQTRRKDLSKSLQNIMAMNI